MIRFGIVALLFFSFCTKKTKVPDDILHPAKMEKLLLDLLHVDEFLNQKKSDTTIAADSFNRTNLYHSVFVLHKTSKENFKKSFAFYESHPDLLKIILDSMYSGANKKPVITDSIRKPKLKSKILQKNKRVVPNE